MTGHGPLGPWTVLLSFSVLLAVNGVLWLAQRHKTAATSSMRAQLSAEIAFLRREAAKLNTPSTYAKCAKYQRLAAIKEKQLAELNSGPAVPGVGERIALLCRTLKGLMLALVTMVLWDVPIAQLTPRSVAVPLGRLLAFPYGAELASYGGIAVAPWLLVVDTATSALARAMFPSPSSQQQLAGAGVNAEQLAKEAEATGGRARPLTRVAT